jgi:hypothetical protein
MPLLFRGLVTPPFPRDTYSLIITITNIEIRKSGKAHQATLTRDDWFRPHWDSSLASLLDDSATNGDDDDGRNAKRVALTALSSFVSSSSLTSPSSKSPPLPPPPS